MSARSDYDPVRAAEAIVHRAWRAMLGERCSELEATLQRAFERCDDAWRSLTRAQRFGDPRSIAISQAELETARQAADKAQRIWGQAKQVFDAELGHPAGPADQDGR